MKVERSKTLRTRAVGPLACFTRPELKVERVSYPVITPSAARGILEAVLWKPAIAWRVDRILVLQPIKFTSFRRNEVGTRVPTFKNSPPAEYYADEDRQQRNTVALSEVDYIIEAHFILTSRAESEDSVRKFEEMFERRLEKGQHFHQPYFGCREFVAAVEPPAGDEAPIKDSRDLGLMLHDIDFRPNGKNTARFFPATLQAGVLEVPPWDGETP